MVCDKSKEAWVPAFNFTFILGLAVGSVLFGKLADSWGRRKSLLLAILICTIFSAAGSVVPFFPLYAGTRFLVGVGSEGW